MSTATPFEESYESRVDLGLWKKLARFALRYKRQVCLLVLFAFTTAATDTAFPLVTKAVIDRLQEGGEFSFLPYALAYLGLTVTLSGSVYFFIHMGGWLRTRVSHDIRQAGFENVQRLSFSYFDKRPVGWLMARMTSDCERLSNIMAWGLLDMVWGFTLMTSVATVMFVLDPKLAALALSVIPVLWMISSYFQKRILKSSRIVRKTNSRITAAYNEGIMGVRTTKVFVREEENGAEFRTLTDEMLGASVHNLVQSALYTPIVLTLGSLATGFVLAVGGFEVATQSMGLGTLVAFVFFSRQFFDPITEISRLWAEMQMAHASAERILGLIEAEPEIQDSPSVRARLALAADDGLPADLAADGYPGRIGGIEFQDVSFAYVEGERVLRDFDLSVAAGETIALVGATGGGKSTIVSLLCRFYEPTEGRILIDGVDYRDRSLHWLQSNLGIVLQTPHLFSGSISDNIRYGRLEASDAEIEEAARTVGAHDFIEALEQGYATEVGEGGGRLSTGEKQLVSFARAILADPQLLVMDEATSSIDTETEQLIQRGLERVLGGRTSFVIAHRLSTVRNADRILVIQKGRIAEMGTHAELLSRRGAYYELYTQQCLRDATRSESAWGLGGEPDIAPAT